ncbi:hypothetical protein [Streptococcus sp. X13SY08]|nr:hypothetical protein [Streptococcus sp. X13SY08]
MAFLLSSYHSLSYSDFIQNQWMLQNPNQSLTRKCRGVTEYGVK